MADNIFDDNYRRNFLSKADFKSLNDYLKNMDRLSKKKGGKYLELYNKDLEFIMSLNDDVFQDGGDIISIFGKKPNNTDDDEDDEKEITMTEQVCDTEAYVTRINNIVSKAPNKETELSMIKDKIQNNINIKQHIQRFIDIIKTIDNSITQNDFNLIKQITKLVSSNKLCLKEVFEYMGKALDKNLVPQEFIPKISELRSKKNTMTKAQYNNVKDTLIKTYVKKIGFRAVCIGKLVEKIIYVYKNKK